MKYVQLIANQGFLKRFGRRPSCRRRFTAAWCAGLFLLSPRLFAFEGWEHEAMGTMSLIVASNHVARLYGDRPDLTERLRELRVTTAEFGRGLSLGTDQTDITFGTIVKLVDYMRDPYNMTHQWSAGGGWPTSSASCNLIYLRKLSSDNVSYLSASHDNQNHFQGRAMFAFWFWHGQAVQQARAGNLWGGLLLEAYANHFLEDLFAPGHILAPRDDNAHDIYTLALHDIYNARGLTYVVGAPTQMSALVESTKALVRTKSLTIPPGLKASDSHQLHLNLTNLQAFSQSLMSTSAQVYCYGDHQLTQNPAQVPLVATYCARAVSDVLESYLQAAEINSFKNYRWQAKVFPMRLLKPNIEGVDMRLNFGELSCLDHPMTIGLADRRPWLSLAGNESVETNADWFPVTETLHHDGYRNPVIGINLGVQTVSFGSSTHLRALFEVETIVYGKRYDFLRQNWRVPDWLPGQLVVTVGYSGVAGTEEQGHGVYTRAIVPMPRLDLNFSLMAGLRYHTRDEFSGWGDFEKLRVEWGLHLVSLFAGVGHERFATARDGLANAVAVEVGLSFGGPVSTFRRLVPGK